MDDDDFERALIGRLEAVADARVQVAAVPLAELRGLGRRRLLRRRGTQAAAAAAVVLAGLVPLLPGGPGGTAAPAATAPVPAPTDTELRDLSCRPDGSSAPPGTAPIGDDRLDVEADRAWRFALREDRYHITNVCVDRPHGRVRVYRVPGSGLDARLTSELADAAGDLDFRDARYSQDDLAHVVTAVVRDTAYWRDRGVQIVGVGALEDGSGIGIGTPQAATARADLVARYRPCPVQVVEQDAPPS